MYSDEKQNDKEYAYAKDMYFAERMWDMPKKMSARVFWYVKGIERCNPP